MLRRALIVSLAISMMTHCALGQSTFGTIVGVVKDPGGLVVAGAPDQLSNLDDKSSRDAVADGDGWFQFLNVKPGKYAVEVQASAFAGFKMPSVQLDARQTLRVDVALKLAGNSEVVEVSDQAPVINTESATIGDTKDFQQVSELPVNYRGATTSSLAVLATVPGAQQDANGNVAVGGDCRRRRSIPWMVLRR